MTLIADRCNRRMFSALIAFRGTVTEIVDGDTLAPINGCYLRFRDSGRSLIHPDPDEAELSDFISLC